MTNSIYPEDWNEVHLALDYKKRRNNYWAMLKTARKDYYQNLLDNNIEYAKYETAFYEHMISVHGLRVILEGGSISAEYEIVDEKKYVMFLMKYGG